MGVVIILDSCFKCPGNHPPLPAHIQGFSFPPKLHDCDLEFPETGIGELGFGIISCFNLTNSKTFS